MSFIAGFGKTFGKGIVDAYDDNQNKKQELFKLQYQTFLDQKEQRKKTQDEQNKIAKQAKMLSQQIGDPQAAAKLYEYGMTFGTDAMIKVAEDGRIARKASQTTGMGGANEAVEQTDRNLREYVDNAQNTEDPMLAEGRAFGLSQKSRQNVVKDLDAATRGDYSRVMSTDGIPSPFAGQDTGGYEILLPEKEIKAKDLDDLYEIKRQQTKAGDLTAAADTQLQINTKVLAMQHQAQIENPNRQPVTSYMEVNPTTGIAQAVLGNWEPQPDGSRVFRTLVSKRSIPEANIAELNSDQAKAVMSWYDDMSSSETYKKFNENASVAGELFDILGRLDTVADRYPNALNAGGALASGARGVLNNLRGVLNTVKTEIDAMGDPQTKKRVDTAVDDAIMFLEMSDPNMETAEARDIVNSLSNLAAYKIAGTLEEGGRFSDPDIQRHLASLKSSTDIDSFRNNIAQLGGLVYQKLSQDSGSLAEKVYHSARGVIVYTGVNPGVDIRTIEERVQGSPYGERALNLIKNTRQIYEGAAGQPADAGQYDTPTEASKAKLRENPSLREAYEKRFGPGSAEEVLGGPAVVPTD